VLAGLLASLAVSPVAFAPAAIAADSVYWGNNSTHTISFARLDGSGGGNLATPGITPAGPEGVTIDAAAGRIYWLDYVSDQIGFANLDGSGGAGHLSTTGATLSGGFGLAIDPAGGRLYWANSAVPKISFAKLNGSGGQDLDTTGGSLTGNPESVAVDPLGGRVWWTAATTVSYANSDGSGGGGNLNTTGATVSGARGVAIDRSGGKVYWANPSANTIAYAKLDGTGGGGTLNTAGATVDKPTGVAVDPAAGRIYWANSNTAVTAGIAFANLDGSGGGNLSTAGATVGHASFPVLMKAPSPAGPPAISRSAAPGTVLSCSQGSWAPDLLGAFLYRVPQGFAYQWSRDGAAIAGATGSTHSPTATGTYRCTVTGANAAGSSSQTSGPHDFALPAFGATTRVKLALRTRRIPATGPVAIRIVNANGFAITGRLSGKTAKRVSTARGRRISLKARSFSVAANSRRTVRLKLPKALRRVLRRDRKLTLVFTAKVRDPSGRTRSINRKLAPRLKSKR
jgi:hypothetical protein